MLSTMQHKFAPLLLAVGFTILLNVGLTGAQSIDVNIQGFSKSWQIFEGNFYRLFNSASRHTGDEAEAICRAFKSSLARPETENEFQFLVSLTKEFKAENVTDCPLIGQKRIAPKGPFVESFYKWCKSSNEPDNRFPPEECTVLVNNIDKSSPTAESQPCIADVACQGTPPSNPVAYNRFICKSPGNGPR